MEELEPKELQEENQTESSHLPSGGKLIFGAKKPAAYAFAHPWPPTPTNLTKKQVLRSARSEKRDREGSLCKIKKARSISAPPKAPKHTSAIELAIYWDRSPFWNFMLPDSLTCPVHGRAERSRDSSAKSRRSCDSGRDSLSSKGSPSLKEVKQGRKSADSTSTPMKPVKEEHHTNGSSHSRESSCTDRVKNKERVMSSEHFSKEEDAVPSNLSNSRRRSKSAIDLQKSLQESSSRYKANGIGIKPSSRRSSSTSSLSSVHQSIKNLHDMDAKKDSIPPDIGQESLRRSMSANSVSQRALALPKNDEKVEEGKVEENHPDEKTEKVKTEGESKYCEWNPPRIVRPISDDPSKATKGVQIVEKELNKRFPVSGYLCPLHGSYSRGVARRNTPKFRTVLMRDTSAQADMEVVAAHYCERAKRLAQQVRKSEGNHYSYRNLKRMCKSAGKARDFSEYEENYKNPSSLANAMKRNRNVSTCHISNYSFYNHGNR